MQLRCSILFTTGNYTELAPSGARAENVLAFLRSEGATAAITIVPVRARALLDSNDMPFVPPAAWGDTAVTLPPEREGRQWRNALTGETVSATK